MYIMDNSQLMPILSLNFIVIIFIVNGHLMMVMVMVMYIFAVINQQND